MKKSIQVIFLLGILASSISYAACNGSVNLPAVQFSVFYEKDSADLSSVEAARSQYSESRIGIRPDARAARVENPCRFIRKSGELYERCTIVRASVEHRVSRELL